MLKRLKSALKPKLLVTKENLSAQDIRDGLECLSKYIRQLNPGRAENPLHIVVAGGACSVSLLHSRSATKDIDFFTEDPEVMEELFAAKHLVDTELKIFPGDWLNADMIAFVLNHAGCEQLFSTSVQLGVIFYRSDVLVAYVADWRYQLVNKITRASQVRLQYEHIIPKANESTGGLQNEINLLDAVSILRVIVEANLGQPLDRAIVRTWYSFGPALTDAEIKYVNNAYQERFGVVGII